MVYCHHNIWKIHASCCLVKFSEFCVKSLKCSFKFMLKQCHGLFTLFITLFLFQLLYSFARNLLRFIVHWTQRDLHLNNLVSALIKSLKDVGECKTITKRKSINALIHVSCGSFHRHNESVYFHDFYSLSEFP